MPPKEISTKQETVVAEATLENSFLTRDKLLKKRGAKVYIWGSYGIGKSYFAFTFPQPIYVISTEFGVDQLLHHFPDKDIKIMECSEPYTPAPTTKHTGKTDERPAAVDPLLSLKKFDEATMLLKDVTEGTIVVDSCSDLWEWWGAWIEYNADKFTQSGQMMRTEWGKANTRYKWMLMRLFSRPVNVVMTGRSQNVYSGDGKETTVEKFSGQKNTPYIPDIVIHLEKKSTPKIDQSGKVTGSQITRTGTITKLRFNDIFNNTITMKDPTYDVLKESLKDKVPDQVFK